MIESLKKYNDALAESFVNNKVKKAYIFGSYASGRANEESDIDLLIEFEENLSPLERGELWWSLYDQLRKIFKKDIDLLTPPSLSNPYLIESIENSKILIYAA